MRWILGCGLIFMSFWAGAQVPPQGVARQIYADLMNDFYDEILTMDAVHEAQQDRLQAIEDLKAALQSSRPEQFQFQKDKSWAQAWPPRAESVRTPQRKTFDLIAAEHFPVSGEGHSIRDLDGYLKARLGAQAVHEIRTGRVTAVVLGGEEDSLRSLLKVPEHSVYKLPSLYEKWGIRKYLIPLKDQTPILAYLVPPAREYLEHYQMMLTQTTGRQAPVYRSVQDFEKWKLELADGVRKIGNQLGGQFDYVVLGYYNQWPEVLKGKIREQKEWELPQGHLGRYFQIQTEGKSIGLLTLGHSQTVWGEASAYLLEGAFDFRPRGIFFLGSAGSISDKTQVYQISAPQSFRTKQSKIEIDNLVHLVKGKVALEVPAQFTAIHGNTSSPASQTLNYLVRHAEEGIDTLDVEQSLIAASVARHNKRHSTQIKFGAVNLITDKPLGHADHDLDRIDHSKKAKARLAAVQMTFSALLEEKKLPTQCGRVH